LSQADAELLMQAVKRGFIDEQSVVGVKVPEGSKIGDVFEALAPPSLQYEALFNKEPTINSINRISNTSDAIRGVQYKTNTNEASVQSYQDAARMSVGAKIEVVEDVMADLCKALLEQCVQNMSKNEVEGLIGKKLSEGWQNMSLEEYNKRFAIQVAQAIGQFASAAPMTSMKVALRVLEQAFTEVVIKPEDWDLMEKEMEMNMMRGNSTGANAPPQPGQNGPPPPQPGGGAPVPGGGGPGAAPAAPGGIPPELANLPPEIKKKVMEMHAAGAPPEQIAQLLKQAVGAQGAPGAPPPGGPPQAGPPPVMQ
jgi:hypothetical protein